MVSIKLLNITDEKECYCCGDKIAKGGNCNILKIANDKMVLCEECNEDFIFAYNLGLEIMEDDE